MGSIANGNWRTGRPGQKQAEKAGVAQALVRLSYAASISQIRRTTSGIEETSKSVGPRILHGTQFGFLCPAETPEGGKVGLVKNFSMECKCSVGTKDNDREVLRCINNFTCHGRVALRRLDEELSGVKVLMNGRWIGTVDKMDAPFLVQYLKSQRTQQKISYQTSISYNEQAQEFIVATDTGRVLRPLFVISTELNEQRVVKKCTLNITKNDINAVYQTPDGWKKLLMNEKRLIEYVDPYEEEQSLICMDLQHYTKNLQLISDVQNGHNYSQLPLAYTHMEIHPCLMLSAICSLIPFPDHNQAPRNLF